MKPVTCLISYDDKILTYIQKHEVDDAEKPQNRNGNTNYMNNPSIFKSQSNLPKKRPTSLDVSSLKTPLLKTTPSNEIKQINSLFDGLSAWGTDEISVQSWDIVTPLNKTEISSHVIVDGNVCHQDPVVQTREISTTTDDDDFHILRNVINNLLPKHIKVINTCSRDINKNISRLPQINYGENKIMIDKSSLTEEFLDEDKVNLENLELIFPNIDKSIIKSSYKKYNRDCKISFTKTDKTSTSESHKIRDNSKPIENSTTSLAGGTARRPERRRRNHKNNNCSSDNTQDLKNHIEGKVAISEKFYSKRILRLKQRYESSSAISEPEPPKVELNVSDEIIGDSQTRDSEIYDSVKEDNSFVKIPRETLLVADSKLRAGTTRIPDIMKEERELTRRQKKVGKWKEDMQHTLAAILANNKNRASFNNIENDIRAMKESSINIQKVTNAYNNCKQDQGRQDAICYRAIADQYLEVRTNLYEKAQKYYRNGKKGVAQFYSDLASEQSRHYEHANRLATTIFVNEYCKRIGDLNTLDLHRLSLQEAISLVDVTLDRHIELLRFSSSKNRECLQIITGKGNNSQNGLPQIRPAVIRRLKERNIRYQQLNPGLLKIKVTNFSNLSSEL